MKLVTFHSQARENRIGAITPEWAESWTSMQLMRSTCAMSSRKARFMRSLTRAFLLTCAAYLQMATADWMLRVLRSTMR